MGVIRRLEDRVQQLTQVNAEADAEISRMRQDADVYRREREKVMLKMKEFEERLLRYLSPLRLDTMSFLPNYSIFTLQPTASP